MGNVVLHPVHGVNPKVTSCRQCGKSVGVALVGRRDFITTCPQCDLKLIGGGKCPTCKVAGVDRKSFDELGIGNELPIELCDDCHAKNIEAEDVVKAGGIFWRCTDCGSGGAIRASSEFAQAVRKQMGIEPPDPCGVEFSKAEGCPVCGDDSA